MRIRSGNPGSARPPVADPDPAGVVSAFAVEYATLCDQLPGFDGLVASDVTLVSVGLPFARLNLAIGARFTTESADARIDDVIGWFDARNLPFAWEVGPGDLPPDLSVRLVSHGLALDPDSLPGMAAPLANLPPLVLPDGATIELVRDVDVFRDWIDVFQNGFEMPPEIGDAFSNFAVLGFGDELPYRMVLARMAGRPVAVALGFLAGGGALILNVATLPDSRRKGLGRAVTLAAMRACATTGATIAVLQSSEMGYEVYRRLGFEEFARYRSFARIEA